MYSEWIVYMVYLKYSYYTCISEQLIVVAGGDSFSFLYLAMWFCCVFVCQSEKSMVSRIMKVLNKSLLELLSCGKLPMTLTLIFR